MKLKKVILLITIFSTILLMFPAKVFAIMPVYKYNLTSVLISNIMEVTSVILGIVYFILSVIYLIKTKDKNTLNQRIRTLIIWLIITTVIISTLRYFAPIVKEIGMSVSGRKL